MSITTDVQSPTKGGKKKRAAKSSDRQLLVHRLEDEHSCYVLITCRKPCEDGEMQVEFSYHGEPALVSYLLHGAQNYIEGEMDESLSV